MFYINLKFLTKFLFFIVKVIIFNKTFLYYIFNTLYNKKL